MSIRNAIASVAVKDLKISLPWYARLLGRGPDHTDQVGMVEWILEQGGRLRLHQQPAGTGRGSLILAVGNLDTEVLQLNRCGITTGEVIRTSTERTLIIEDPDSNNIVLAEVLLTDQRGTNPLADPKDKVQGTHPLERALESIAADPRLNPGDVRNLLDSLILDLEALLRASDESMSGSDSGLAAPLLQRAHIMRGKIATSQRTS